MTTLLISDLHLSESRPDVAQAFLGFLQTQASQAEALYILGDFFNAWIGDDFSNPAIDTIIKALRQVSDHGVALYIMHGNRDFLLGEQFAEQTGAQLIDDPCVVSLYGQNVLLMHGDSLCTGDQEYMAFRQQIRNPVLQQQLLAKPIAERIAIAEQIRSASKSANSNKAEDIMDVTPQEVVDTMNNHQVDLMIHGHTHRPMIHDVELDGRSGKRVVLGDWDTQGWLVKFDESGYELESFDLGAVGSP